MARSPSGKQRIRVASTLEIRSWVIEPDADEVYQELDCRISALDAVGEPWAEVFIQGGRQLAMATLAMLGREVPRSLTSQEENILVRAGAANMVATYWAQHEYRRGILLPPVMVSGVPWDTLPDHIHVLDLSPERIRQAAPKTATVTQFAAAQRAVGEADTLPFLFGAAHAIIERFGPWAVFNPAVLTPLFWCLVLAQYAPTRAEAEHAANAADSLLEALRPNLSRRLSRTPDRLSSMRKSFEELLDRAKQFKQVQLGQQRTRATLARAKDWFGARVDNGDLRRWEHMTAVAIALEVLASQRGMSEKALRDYRRLADQVEGINTAWEEFFEHLRKLPEQDQRRITAALPPLASPRPPEHPSGK